MERDHRGLLIEMERCRYPDYREAVLRVPAQRRKQTTQSDGPETVLLSGMTFYLAGKCNCGRIGMAPVNGAGIDILLKLPPTQTDIRFYCMRHFWLKNLEQ